MAEGLSINQNCYFDPLILNLYRLVKLRENIFVQDKFDLSADNETEATPSYVLKTFIYICGMIKDDKMLDNTIFISSKDMRETLHISVADFDNSLKFLETVAYSYNKPIYLKNGITKDDFKTINIINIIEPHEKLCRSFKVNISQDFIDLFRFKPPRQKRYSFYTMPLSLLSYDGRYKHLIIIALYILLERARNFDVKSNITRETISINRFIMYACMPIEEKSSHISRELIEPFDKNLNIICQKLNLKYEFVGGKPKTLTDYINGSIKIFN